MTQRTDPPDPAYSRRPGGRLHTWRPQFAKGVVDLTPDRPPIDWDDAVARYVERKWSLAMIARHAGYSEPRVRQGLLERGVELRERTHEPYEHWLLRGLWRFVLERVEHERTPKGRPVALARAWRRFEGFRAFAEAAGYRRGMALVRLDPERGFRPGNVRFVKADEVNTYTKWARPQRPSKLITAFGETKGFMEWTRDPRCKVGATGLLRRLKGGVDPEVALTTPARTGRRLLPHPERALEKIRRELDPAKAARLYARGASISEIARELGFSRACVRDGLTRHGVELRPRSSLTTTRDGMLLNKLWSSLRARCNNPRDRLYPYHGAKGVRVGREWERFVDFHQWAVANGWKPGLCLQRIDERKGYVPGNCRFVTQSEVSKAVARPSRPHRPYVLVTAFGETKGMMAWSRDRRCKVAANTLAQRLAAGFRPEDALATPPQREGNPGKQMLTAFGQTRAVVDWLRDPRCQVTRGTLVRRLAKGMEPEAALTTKPWRTTKRRGDAGGGGKPHGTTAARRRNSSRGKA